MSCNTVLSVNNVSKVYKVYEHPKEKLLELIDKKKRSQDYYALKPLSFDIEKGSSVGILGRNGSGKSTLLQMIAGTVTPSSGTIDIKGRVVPLLELGSGFNQDYTGRENVYLNGAMYGISKKEMENKFADIEEFADIGEYIDQPVKTYSSGMFARLAFAVAINMEPDILIVDEILAVGDMAFQAKCVSKMRKMKDEGLTLLFVSHSVDAIKSLCNKAILLQKGELISIGNSDVITNKYLSLIREDLNKANQSEEKEFIRSNEEELEKNPFKYGPGDVFFNKVEMIDNKGNIAQAFNFGENATLKCTIRSKINVKNINVSFLIRDITGVDLFGSTMFDEKVPLFEISVGEEKEVEFEFPITLRPGSYSVSIAVNSVSEKDYTDVFLYEQIDAATAFEVLRIMSRPVHYKFHVPVGINVNEKTDK